MTLEIRKPAAWAKLPFEQLLAIEAGQAYVAEQLGGKVEPVATFRSSRSSSCSYDVFEDGSLWFHSNGDDEVWEDASDLTREMEFGDLSWDEIDSMDRDLLVHLVGEKDAKFFYESRP